MARDTLAKVRSLRQTDEAWECTVREARAWIAPPGGEPYRPYLVLMVSQASKVIRSHICEEAPAPDQVLGHLLVGMRRPVLGAGPERRPAVIYVDDEAMAEALASGLQEVGVGCEYRPSLREIEQALLSMERFVHDREPLLGLLRSPGVTPPVVQGLFEAAAAFYREALWRWIDDSRPIEVRYPPDGRPRYAVVMGHGGLTYGLAVYNSPDDLLEVYSQPQPEQLIGTTEWTSLLFCEVTEVPFDDLDDVKRYGWPVAGDLAYPVPMKVSRSGHPFRPGKSELLWFEAALLAIPSFVRDHMRADTGFCNPAEATLAVAMAHGEDPIHLRYPVPGFELDHEEEETWMTLGEEQQAALERNGALFYAFMQWLVSQGLSAKTVKRHLDKIDFFANAYLVLDGGQMEMPRPADQTNRKDVDDFLSAWFLNEAYRVSEGTMKATLASLKKFHTCLKEMGLMPAERANEILELLRTKRSHYVELASDYRQREEEELDEWLRQQRFGA